MQPRTRAAKCPRQFLSVAFWGPPFFLLLARPAERLKFGFWSRFLKAPQASLAVLENGTLAPVRSWRPSQCSELAGRQYHNLKGCSNAPAEFFALDSPNVNVLYMF